MGSGRRQLTARQRQRRVVAPPPGDWRLAAFPARGESFDTAEGEVARSVDVPTFEEREDPPPS